MSSETNEPIGAARKPAPAIAFENVTCSFETPEGVYTATKDVSFSIGDGEFVSVVGPTGWARPDLRRSPERHQPSGRLHVSGRKPDALGDGD